MPTSESFPSFRKDQYAKPQPHSLNDPSEFNGPEEGEIIQLYKSPKNKYRADIRLISGPILTKVRLAGPYYGKEGFQHGHKQGYMIGQRVKVTYLENRRDSYTASAVYSLAAGEKQARNLSKNTDYDPEEVSSGHESGHKTIWQKDKLIFQDKKKQIYISIDYSTDEIILKTKSANLSVRTDSLKGEVKKSSIELTSDKTVLSHGDTSITADDSMLKLKGKKIILSNGIQEIEFFLHKHTSNVPSTPTGPALP